MTDNKLKYIAYLRKSTRKDERQILSIPSQKSEMMKYLETHPLNIIDWVEEKESAKEAGKRPVYEDSLGRIHKGEADGFFSYHPNRLARNRTEGGEVVDNLKFGKIKDLKFVSCSFENTPEGRKHLATEFNDASFYSDNLGREVNRGYREKQKTGWRCISVPKLGYLNYREKPKHPTTIITDPLRFDLVKNAWHLIISGTVGVDKIIDIANAWGLRSKKGKNISRSTWYRIFSDQFYYGYVEGAPNNMGLHTPMITKEEFELVQKRLKLKKGRGDEKRDFPYRKSCLCGVCGHTITFEDKPKKKKIYAHCAARRQSIRCKQKSIELKDMSNQVNGILNTILIPDSFIAWANKNHSSMLNKLEKDYLAEINRNEENIKNNKIHLKRLTDMRLAGDFDDSIEDYNSRKKEYQDKLNDLAIQISNTNNKIQALKSFSIANNSDFVSKLLATIATADNQKKTELIQKLYEPASFILKDKIISMKLRRPFNV